MAGQGPTAQKKRSATRQAAQGGQRPAAAADAQDRVGNAAVQDGLKGKIGRVRTQRKAQTAMNRQAAKLGAGTFTGKRDVESIYRANPTGTLSSWVDAYLGDGDHSRRARRKAKIKVIAKLARMFRQVHRQERAFWRWARRRRKRPGEHQTRYDRLLGSLAGSFRGVDALVAEEWKRRGLGPVEPKRIGWVIYGPARRASKMLARGMKLVVRAAAKAVASRGPERPGAGASDDLAAAMKVVSAWKGWVRMPGDQQRFGQRFAAEANKQAPTGQALTHLLASAEVALVRTTIPRYDARTLKVSTWLAKTRADWEQATIDPPWVFYRKYIQAYTFLGGRMSKSAGMHRDVVAVLPAVEASYKRISGQDPKGLKYRFFGFRMQHSVHANSQHPRGRAFDLGPAYGGAFMKGSRLTLASVMSGKRLDQMAMDYSGSKVLAERLAPLQDQERVIAEAVAKGDQSARAKLDEVRAKIEAVRQSKLGKRLLSQHTTLHDDMRSAEASLRKAWGEVTLSDGSVNVTVVVVKVMHEVQRVMQRMDKTSAKMKTASKQEKSVLGKRQKGDRKWLVKLYRLYQDLRDPKTAKALLQRRTRKGKAVNVERNPSTEQLADKGFSGPGGDGGKGTTPDRSKALIQAFAENGWYWGAGFREMQDAMHVELRRPVAGLKR